MGLIIGAGNLKPANPYDYYYGVKIPLGVADPVIERVGRPELHAALPVQSKMRRCLLKDDGTVNCYLDATDSTKTETGATANLTGTAGMVMVEIPEHYVKCEFDGNNHYVLISEHPLPGFRMVRKCYRSAYEATVDRTSSAKPKLASVVNKTAPFRGGNNTASWDGTYRTLLGLPATNLSLSLSRTYARNRGAAGLNGVGWNCDLYEAQLATYWLFVIEYANRNCQAEYNPQLTPAGYRQGGLGMGVTTVAGNKWDAYNGYNPFIPCGVTNCLGNATGIVEFTMPSAYDSTSAKVMVPSYRGIENPFGHIWSWTDGVLAIIQSATGGGKSKLYVGDNPALFGDDLSAIANYNYRGDLPRADGYIKTMLYGDSLDNMPTSVGANATAYYCDYYQSIIPSTGEAVRGVLLGGRANNGSPAGLAYTQTTNSPTAIDTIFGTRLCFIPN